MGDDGRLLAHQHGWAEDPDLAVPWPSLHGASILPASPHGQGRNYPGRPFGPSAPDGPQAVGERVGMDTEPPRGFIGVVVGLHVGPERRDQRSTVFGVVAAERTQGVFDEVVPVLQPAAVEQDA